MFNNGRSDIIERKTYSDEFEKTEVKDSAVSPAPVSVSEATSFNAKIADNFDRIIHYDAYSETAVKENSYNGYDVQSDCSPSATTMQFRGMPKSEIYRDMRDESASYEKTSVVRPRAKILMACLAAVITILAVLIVFNTALLNNMNRVIESKQAQIVAAESALQDAQKKLDHVSSDEEIGKWAEANGGQKS